MSLNKTTINFLDDNEDDIDYTKEYESHMHKILDMDLSHETRINTLNSLDDKSIIEIINKINSMYLVSGTHLLKLFIISICKKFYSTYS